MNRLHRRVSTGEKDPQAPDFVLAMPVYPAKILPIPRSTLNLVVFWVGFFLQCNVLTASLGLRFLHISDIIVLLGIPLIYSIYIRLFNTWTMIFYIVMLTFSFIMSVILFHGRAEGELYTSAFTFFYTLFFLPFTFLIFKENLVSTFCWGIFIGFAAAAALLFLDLAIHDQLSALGLAFIFDADAVLEALARGEFNGATLRLAKPGGIWAHGNEAGPVFALAAAAAAYLAETKRSFWVYARFASLYFSTFTLTQNRSGLFAVIFVGLVLYIRRLSAATLKRSFLTMIAAVFGMALALPLGLFNFADGVIAKRFLEDDNASNNVSERLSSLFDGLGVMFQYPFGIGFTARTNVMQSMSGLPTPHNGFLSTAYANGMFYTLLLVAAIIYLFLRRRKVGLFVYAAVAVSTVYFFEELSYNPCIMAFVGLIISYVALDLDYRVARAAVFKRVLSRRHRNEQTVLLGGLPQRFGTSQTAITPDR